MTGYFGSGNNFRGFSRVQQFWIEFDFKQELSSCWDGRPCQSKVGRKVGAAVPLSVGRELGPHLTQCGLGRSLPQYQVAS